MAKEMIRIRLKAYDHQVIDQSAEKIVETAKRTYLAILKEKSPFVKGIFRFFHEILSERIHELRMRQGYTQVSLAKKLGVSKQAVSNWENGNIQPSIYMLIRIADLFSVTTDYLLGREYVLQADLSRLPPEVAGHILLLIKDLER